MLFPFVSLISFYLNKDFNSLGLSVSYSGIGNYPNEGDYARVGTLC